jgi:hypothetical protein
MEPGAKVGLAGAARLQAIARTEIEARVGVQTVKLAANRRKEPLAVRLSGTDRLPEDDVAPVAPEVAALRVAVLGSALEPSGPTGGRPLVEQALDALDTELTVTPIAVLPDQPSELSPYSLVVLDDPSGIGPEARDALVAHAERGAVLVAFLGPQVEATKLGSTLEPFAHGSVKWQADPEVRGVDTPSLGWLGEEARSLDDLGLRGRALLDPGGKSGARVLGKMLDGAPFLVEERVGRGGIFTLTLPSSLAESDLALRPGFVALLAHFVDSARASRGVRQSVAGSRWPFASERPLIEGPAGVLELRDRAQEGWVAAPALHGLYRVKSAEGEELRTVVLDPAEITTLPTPPAPELSEPPVRAGAGSVDVSAESAILLVLLLALELGLRAWRGARPGAVDSANALR